MASEVEQALAAMGEATAARADWTFALDALADAFNAEGVVLVPARASEVAGRLRPSRSMEAAAEHYMKEGWFRHDERAIRGWPRVPRGGVILEQDITTAEERAGHPFYQDFLRKHGLEWFAGLPCATDVSWVLSLQRRPRDGAFEGEEARRMAQIGPHIATFLRLEEQLAFTGQRMLLEAYEIAGRAAVLLGAQQRVLGLTTAAEAVIAGAIAHRGGKLAALDKTSDTRLQKLIQSVTGVERLSGLYGRVAVRMPRGGVLIVEALPLPHTTAGPRVRAVLTISNPYKKREPEPPLLADAFRLTPAQTRLAQELLKGGSAKEIAQRLSLSHETVRDQLRQLFDKTGTNRQVELLRLLERFSRER